jgi:hypothetical protein
VPLGADQFGKQGGHHADAAAKVGDAHPPVEACVQEHAAAARPVECVQDGVTWRFVKNCTLRSVEQPSD